MKHAIILLAILTGTYANAQNHESSTAPEMEKLSNLIGHWEGNGWIQRGNIRNEFRQTEDVQVKLNGTTLLIEGNAQNNTICKIKNNK